MYKKGELGMGMVMLVVLPIIVLIMATFVTLATGIAKDVGFNDINAQINWKKSLLLKNIYFGEQEVSVLEGILMLKDEKIKRNEMENALKSLLNKEDNCLVLAVGEKKNPYWDYFSGPTSFYLDLDDSGRVNSINLNSYPQLSVPDEKFPFYEKGLLTKVSLDFLDSEKVYFEYYYGNCPEVSK